MEKDRLAFSIAEVAQFLGINEITIRRAIKSGNIRAFRIGGIKGPYRIAKEEIEALIKGNNKNKNVNLKDG